MQLRDAFASELSAMPVQLHAGTQFVRIGKIDDIIVSAAERFPPVVGFYIKGADGVMRYAPFSSVETLSARSVTLATPPLDINQAAEDSGYLRLNRELLDKQIVDVDGRKVVRINDVKLAPAGDHLRVIAAEVGLPGLIRRLGMHRLGDRLNRSVQPGIRPSLISWDAVQPLHHDEPGGLIRLRVPQDRINRIHPADLAAIIEDLAVTDQASLLGSLPEETAADAFEQLNVDTQLSILEDLQPDRAADIIENMNPDDAADLLAEIETDKQQQILELMEPQEAEDVRELLAHPEDTAGGLMNTQYLSIPPGLSVAEAFNHIRTSGQEIELVYYVYILDAAERILGVVSLRELLTARPEQPIADIMIDDVVTVDLQTNKEEVASTIARYDFLAVPVVDAEGKMQGIVTVDDIIDVLLPEKLRKTLPRVGRSRNRPARVKNA